MNEAMQNVEEVMRGINSGVTPASSEHVMGAISVTEYKMDEDDALSQPESIEPKKIKEDKKPPEAKNALSFSEEQVEEIGHILEEISLAYSKQDEVDKEDLLQRLLLQKGAEIFFKERKNILAEILLKTDKKEESRQEDLLVVCEELFSVGYAIEKESIFFENKKPEKELSCYTLDHIKMGQKLSASTNIMVSVLDSFEKNVSLEGYKLLRDEVDEIRESHLFVEEFLTIS